jgi:hypothetical protein
MTVLRNNFDGGPDGTSITVANSGQVPGNDAFNGVSADVSNNTIQYTAATDRPTAEYTGQFSSTSPAVHAGVVWSTSMGSQSQVWYRQYVKWMVLPTTSSPSLFTSDNGTVYCGIVALNNDDDKIMVVNSTETVSSSFSSSISLDTWYRIECRFQFSSTTGNWEARLYAGDDVDTDSPTETISASNWNLGASSANNFGFGYVRSFAGQPDMRLSGLALSNEGWIGPAPFRAGKGVPGILTNPVAQHIGG